MSAFNLKLSAVLAMFGIAMPMPEFAAGVVLALAGAYAAMAASPPARRASLWTTLLLAALVGVATAIAHPAFLSGVKPQLAMLASGFLSRFIVRALMGIGERIATQGQKISIPGLPDDGKDQ